jgi:hypothetical protein
MRRLTFSPIRLATILTALTLPTCFSLPHLDPGNRVLDDFNEDAHLTPTWSAFSPWVCVPFINRRQEGSDAGQDGGLGGEFDAGQLANPDGGQPVSCSVGPGDGDKPANNQALVSTFDIVAPSGSDPFGVAITTTTTSGSVVDLTGFTQLLIDAELYSTTVGQAMLPSGTKLEVELGCSTNVRDTAIDQSVNITTEAVGWPQIPALPLEMFSSIPASPIQTCLATVDSISFKVQLGRATPGTPIGGTLELDNIAFK